MAIVLIVLILVVAWLAYENSYYKSDKFKAMKNRIDEHIKSCNELNQHIEELKNSSIGIDQLDYGKADYHDASKWNYKRKELKKLKYAPNIYQCSRTVCDNARKQPFKYICKYFNIKTDEASLERVEKMLNDFEAAEQGKNILREEKAEIMGSIRHEIPGLIKTFSQKRLQRELGFEDVDFSTLYFPRYVFKYVSSGGNASTQCDIVMDLDNTNRFVKYLSEIVKLKKARLDNVHL